MIHLLVGGDDLDRESVEVEGDDYRHLFRARRLKLGDRVRLVDGRGGARWSIVGGVAADRARLDLEGPAPTFEPARRLTLLVSVVRPERAVWLVEKATELGVNELQWFVSERTSRAFTRRALDRQRRVAKSALEQSGGARLPRIGAPVPLEESGVDAGTTVLHPGAGTELSAVRGARTLVIGPEGGFSEAEIGWLAGRGASLAALGPRVLRTETAAVAAVAVALYRS